MERHQPSGNAIDDVVEEIGVCDAVHGCVYGEGKEEDVGDVGEPLFSQRTY